MKRLAIAVFATLIAAPAFGQTVSGIMSGLQVVWTGSAVDAGTQPPNLNQLFINPGQVFIDNNLFYVIGGGGVSLVTQTVGTSTQTSNFSFASDVTGLVQSKNTAYYVYAANNYGDGGPTGGTLQFVISTKPPNPGGDPSATLAWTPDGGHPFSTTQAVFLGSYITDINTSTNMVPFLRNGDQTILTPAIGTNSSVDTPYIGNVNFPHVRPGGLGYPWVQALTIYSGCAMSDGGAGTCVQPPIPLSSSALLIDFVANNTDTSSHDVRILNPSVPFDITTSCAGPMQYSMNIDPSSIEAVTTYDHARIKTAVNTYVDGGVTGGGVLAPLNTLEVGGCVQPGNTYSLGAVYAGYVEVPHHIGF